MNHFQPALEAAGGDAGVSRAPLQGRHGFHHRRKAPQLAAAGAQCRNIERRRTKLPNSKMMDVAGGAANMHVGLHQDEAGTGAHRNGTLSALGWPTSSWSTCARRASAPSTARGILGRAACALPRHRREPAARRHAAPKSPPPPAVAWCSSAPSANAPRWRWLLRMPGRRTPRISKAVSTRGRTGVDRWFTVLLGRVLRTQGPTPRPRELRRWPTH